MIKLAEYAKLQVSNTFTPCTACRMKRKGFIGSSVCKLSKFSGERTTDPFSGLTSGSEGSFCLNVCFTVLPLPIGRNFVLTCTQPWVE